MGMICSIGEGLPGVPPTSSSLFLPQCSLMGCFMGLSGVGMTSVWGLGGLARYFRTPVGGRCWVGGPPELLPGSWKEVRTVECKDFSALFWVPQSDHV